MQQLWEQPLILTAIAVVGAAVVLGVLVALLRRRPAPAQLATADLAVDVSQLDVPPPRTEGPRLEVYGVPVHVALIIAAPVGRDSILPPDDGLHALLCQLVPNFERVLEHDRPAVHRWPSQLSVHGFQHAFFNQIALPGEEGKGTPWCSVAGKTSIGTSSYLIGLVGRAKSGNSLGQILVEHEGKWFDAVRVRDSVDR